MLLSAHDCLELAFNSSHHTPSNSLNWTTDTKDHATYSRCWFTVKAVKIFTGEYKHQLCTFQIRVPMFARLVRVEIQAALLPNSSNQWLKCDQLLKTGGEGLNGRTKFPQKL